MYGEFVNMKSSDTEEIDDLVRAHKGGDESAFEELVSRFEPMILKTARSLSLDERDVYSEACLSLRRAADAYSVGSDVTFGLYAKICVTHALLDYAKRNKRKLNVVEIDIADVAVSDGVQTKLEHEELISALVNQARKALSPYEYEVFELVMRGCKTVEIAEKLGKSVKSVENTKGRMLKTLREWGSKLP